MQRPSDTDRPYFAFLASRLFVDNPKLAALRKQIHEMGARAGRPVWVWEFDGTDVDKRSKHAVEAACLRGVRQADEFICLVDGSYGWAWNAAELCVLELEIMMAAVARKPSHFFLLTPYDDDPRMKSLLAGIRIVAGTNVSWRQTTPDDVLRIVRTEVLRGTWPSRVHRKRAFDPGNLDAQFLGGEFVPIDDSAPDPMLIEQLLAQATSQDVEAPIQLIHAWTAIRRLCSVPYSDDRFRAYLPLWDRALGVWGSAAAWYGLHGHLLLGRLAAVNTSLEIRKRIEEQRTPLSIQGSRGALASEYVSIAKTLRGTARRKLFKRALVAINDAISRDPPDPSGMLGIRATIFHYLGQTRKGLKDYQRMLQLRIDAQEDLGRIGEAESELGFGYLRAGRLFKASRLLREGVMHLKRSGRHPFTVRAMRKLTIFYLLTLRPFRAAATLQEATAIATKYDLEDQLRQLRPLAKVLRWF